MPIVTFAGAGPATRPDSGPVPVRTCTELTVDRDETMLLAGLASGLTLPYECASGGCGTCKAQLLAGEVDTLWDDPSGLTDRDRRRGDRVLLCQCRPRSDCTIKLPGGLPSFAVDDGRRDDSQAGGPEPRPARAPGQVVRMERLSPGFALLTVRIDRPVRYLAGQFAVLELSDGTRRAYSMSREPGPQPEPELEFLLRAKPGGAGTGQLFDRTVVGDELVVEAPYGRAYAQSPPERSCVCVGGGSGLGPMVAVAQRLLTENPARSVTLHYGARDASDLVLARPLAHLLERGATVHVSVDRTDGRLPQAWPTVVRGGMVVDVLEALHDDAGDADLYLAGPTPMVDAVLQRLVRTSRVRADRVFFDRFV